jgi:hypothetical protein
MSVQMYARRAGLLGGYLRCPCKCMHGGQGSWGYLTPVQMYARRAGLSPEGSWGVSCVAVAAVSHCVPSPSSVQVPFRLHVIVGPTDTDSVADVIKKKCDDLDAACVVMAKHSKGRLKVGMVQAPRCVALLQSRHCHAASSPSHLSPVNE